MAVKKRIVSNAVAERPVVRMSYGTTTCLFCKRKFEKQRAWAKYCSSYCRMMTWHLQHRRKTQPGRIVEVGGQVLTRSVEALDERLIAEAEREVESLMRRKRKR